MGTEKYILFSKEGFEALMSQLRVKINKRIEKKIAEIPVIEENERVVDGKVYQKITYHIEKQYYN